VALALLLSVAAPIHAAPGEPQIETIEIPAGGMVFSALAAGPRDGEPVLLLHGFPQTSHAYREAMRTLALAGFRAVAPDQRGYSPGARPESVEAYRISKLIGDVVAIADTLNMPRFHLVGHDWGGAAAWGVAGRHSDRILSLTVLSTPHHGALGNRHPYREHRRLLSRVIGRLSGQKEKEVSNGC
jgi:pimeloyl-ACP methyl ester carboxylesterase